jgi:hypothetical protein
MGTNLLSKSQARVTVQFALQLTFHRTRCTDQRNLSIPVSSCHPRRSEVFQWRSSRRGGFYHAGSATMKFLGSAGFASPLRTLVWMTVIHVVLQGFRPEDAEAPSFRCGGRNTENLLLGGFSAHVHHADLSAMCYAASPCSTENSLSGVFLLWLRPSSLGRQLPPAARCSSIHGS